MDTRGENNKSRESRTSKNKQLYNNLYNDTNYSNMVVIDDSNEIDINKIKKIIDKEKRPSREINNNYMYDSLKEYYEIDNKKQEKKLYDINEVLKQAKNKRDLIEEANEKRKIENYKFKNNIAIENELEKTRKVYDALVKEETELLNIMNTLTNINADNKMSETASMALDLLDDLKDDNEKQPKEQSKEEKNAIPPNVKKIEETDKEDSREYSTDTFMFETKDFDGLKSISNGIKKSNRLLKIFIFLITIVVAIACYFVITKYILK